MQSLQGAGEPAARRDPPTARYTTLKAGGFVEDADAGRAATRRQRP
jgi:hypothetical protein